MGIFVLCLRLGGTEPPSGTISALGTPVVQPFYGWIELMGTIQHAARMGNPPTRRVPTTRSTFLNPGTEHHRDSRRRAVNPGELSDHTVRATTDELPPNTGHRI
jgi:hypothetical protein